MKYSPSKPDSHPEFPASCSYRQEGYLQNAGPPGHFRVSMPIVLCSGFLLVALHAPADAAMVFTDSASFQAALPGTANVQNFDGEDAGTVIPNGSGFSGVSYSSNTGLDLIVTDHFDTTSPFNYLGADDDFSNEFVSGDELIFDFSSLVQAFGLFIIGSPGEVLDADFQLVGGGNSVFNPDTPERTLADGGDVFFLGLIDEAGFGSARLNSFGDQIDPFFAFNIDDVTTVNPVPEPSSYLLLSIGLLMFGYQRISLRKRII